MIEERPAQLRVDRNFERAEEAGADPGGVSVDRRRQHGADPVPAFDAQLLEQPGPPAGFVPELAVADGPSGVGLDHERRVGLTRRASGQLARQDVGRVDRGRERIVVAGTGRGPAIGWSHRVDHDEFSQCRTSSTPAASWWSVIRASGSCRRRR
jgi:hypothetical protein